MKLRIVRLLHRYVLNPPIVWLFHRGIVPPGYAMLETTGRRSGQARQTPVGDGQQGDTFWIVAEHGSRASYVRNLQADPRVRVQLRRGLRRQWRDGTAEVVADDDPRERQRVLAAQSLRARSNALIVRTLSTELLSIRIEFDPEDNRGRT